MTLRVACFLFAAALFFAAALCVPRAHAQAPAWTVDAGQHEFTMSVTTAIRVVPTGAGDQLCAYVDADPEASCRGLAEVMLVGSGVTARHLFFLTIYGTSFGETIRFRAYDASLDSVRAVVDSLGFSPDAVVGDPSAPHLLNLLGVSTAIESEQPSSEFSIGGVWPNPSSDAFAVRFASDQPATVEVFDALGRRHALAAPAFSRGDQMVRLDASAWPPGLYVVVVRAGERREARTLTVIR